jgi:hypothetical protein
MKIIKLLGLTFSLVITTQLPSMGTDKYYALQIAQQQAIDQRLNPRLELSTYPTFDRYYMPYVLALNSKLFPEDKPTNDLIQILVDLSHKASDVNHYYRPISHYINARLDDIKSVLDKGADSNVIYRGHNLSWYAAFYNNEYLTYLLKNAKIPGRFDAKMDGTPLWFDIGAKKLNTLLKAGVINVNQKSDDGDTALIYLIEHRPNASSDDRDEQIRLLLQYNADPSITNRNGEHAAQVARRKEMPAPIIQALQNIIDHPRKQKLL